MKGKDGREVGTVPTNTNIYCIVCGRILRKGYSKGASTCKVYGLRCLPTRDETKGK